MKQFIVTGMSCAACSSRVEKAVSQLEEVTSCNVNLLTNSMAVEGTATAKEIIAAVENAGYHAEEKDNKSKKTSEDNKSNFEKNEFSALRNRLSYSLVFLAVLMYFSMGHMMWNFPVPAFFENNPFGLGLLQLLLTTIILVINQKFFTNGFKSLMRGAPNMDSLVALGSGAAFVYSTVALFQMSGVGSSHNAAMEYLHHFYFESSAMIVTLITVGKMLEMYSKGKTTDALKSLMKLAPKTATIIKDGVEVAVQIEEIKKGDIIVIKPGESIPVDGVVLDGSSAVDEALLTGESIPVDKKIGDLVTAATINKSGYLKCEAVRIGEDTTLSQIIKMVGDASATKAPIAKIADKVSGVFVPIVLGIAVVTIAVWLLLGAEFSEALTRGIAVLVISCPCALGLATPVAIMVGNGLGAKHGILFKTAASLEECGRAEVVVFDKTGTITNGEPSVTDVILADGVSEEDLLTQAVCLEKKSEHPIAKAVLSYCEKLGMIGEEVSEFEIMPGNGLTATLNGEKLAGGNSRFITQFAKIPKDMYEKAEKCAMEGKTPLYFAKGAILQGIIAVADVIKKDSAAAVSELKDMGIKVIMLTGDHEKTAHAIAEQAGIDDVIAEVLPEDKEKVVKSLMEQDKVIMVGDGINDAPALTRANIGMAIGAGTDIAIDAADVVLMKNQLRDVVAAIRLSRATLRIIHQNLFWAFVYNVVGIPLAAGAFISLFDWHLNPMFGAAAMSLSSFCVVSNALRLNLFNVYDAKRYKRRKENKKIKEDKRMEVVLKIEGMMCSHCEARVKKCLEEIAEVNEALVSHKEGTARVLLGAEIDVKTLKDKVETEGYKTTVV